jgi:hypothetical protein
MNVMQLLQELLLEKMLLKVGVKLEIKDSNILEIQSCIGTWLLLEILFISQKF